MSESIFDVLQDLKIQKDQDSVDRLHNFQPAPASEPTQIRPGTSCKLDLLAARVAAGQELWHEEDFDVLGDRNDRRKGA